MQRPAQPVGTQRLRAVDDMAHIVHPCRPRRIIADQVHRRIAHRRNRGAVQPDLIQQGAKAGIMVKGAAKNRHFNPGEADGLDIPQQRGVFVSHMGGPQQQAHAGFH